MLTIPLAIIMIIMHFVYADQRDASRAAHEVCAESQVTRVDEHFEFGCEETLYSVHCSHGDCNVRPL